jgi:hypothetical protein
MNFETSIYPIEFLKQWEIFLDKEVGLDFEITYLEDDNEPYGDIGFNIIIFDCEINEINQIELFESNLIHRLKFILEHTLDLKLEETDGKTRV